jgi:hypothetical protein
MTTPTLPLTRSAHASNGVGARAHLLAHLTTGGRADLILHMGGPMAGHDGDPAQLETRDLDALRREHVWRHGVAWETAQAWLADYRGKRYVRPGETITHQVAYSEVAMHMRVAGTEMAMRLQAGGRGPWDFSVQLLNPDGTSFSGPILPGEAGLYHDDLGHYVPREGVA